MLFKSVKLCTIALNLIYTHKPLNKSWAGATAAEGAVVAAPAAAALTGDTIVAVDEGVSRDSRSTSELTAFGFGAAAAAAATVDAAAAGDARADVETAPLDLEAVAVDVVVDFDLSLEVDFADAEAAAVVVELGDATREEARDFEEEEEESTRRSSNPKAATLGCRSGTHSLISVKYGPGGIRRIHGVTFNQSETHFG